MLDGFEVFSSGRARPFITLRKIAVSFSRLMVEQLDFSPYIRVLIDEKGKRAAFQVTDAEDELGYRFFVKPKEGRSIQVKISETALASALFNLTDLKPEGNEGFRFYGEFLEEEKAVLFDMTQEPEKNEYPRKRGKAGDEE